MKTSIYSPVAVLYAKSLAFRVARVSLDRMPSAIRENYTIWVEGGFTPGLYKDLVSAVEMFDLTDSKKETFRILSVLRVPEIQEALAGGSLSELGDYVPGIDFDELNPEYLLNGTPNALLVAICNGQVDPILIAAQTLAGRGFDLNGTWIGFEAAKSYNYFKNRK